MGEIRKPLVSICIPNYNYGHYLEHCFDSVLSQTYSNIEVIFSDNASTDSSYEIAQKYRKKFIDRGIFFKITNNKRNVGSDMNSKLATGQSEGEFVYTLASDDALHPEFIEKCMNIFIHYPNVGTVIVNREEIDENNNITKTAPFYDRSCIIPGEDQAAVYMMAGIAIPAQRMVRRTVLAAIRDFGRMWNVAGDWYNNFLYSCVADVAYLKEDLVQYRVHTGNETSESEKRLLGITEHYQLLNSFVNIADAYGYKKPQARYKEAVQHLGDMCLRYAVRMLVDNNYEIARKYMMLAPILHENICKDNKSYSAVYELVFDTPDEDKQKKTTEYIKINSLNRKISYAPPENSVVINI